MTDATDPFGKPALPAPADPRQQLEDSIAAGRVTPEFAERQRAILDAIDAVQVRARALLADILAPRHPPPPERKKP